MDIKTFNENGISGETMEEVMDNFEPSDNLPLCAMIIFEKVNDYFKDEEFTDVGDTAFKNECGDQIGIEFPELDPEEAGEVLKIIMENY